MTSETPTRPEISPAALRGWAHALRADSVNSVTQRAILANLLDVLASGRGGEVPDRPTPPDMSDQIQALTAFAQDVLGSLTEVPDGSDIARSVAHFDAAHGLDWVSGAIEDLAGAGGAVAVPPDDGALQRLAETWAEGAADLRRGGRPWFPSRAFAATTDGGTARQVMADALDDCASALREAAALGEPQPAATWRPRQGDVVDVDGTFMTVETYRGNDVWFCSDANDSADCARCGAGCSGRGPCSGRRTP